MNHPLCLLLGRIIYLWPQAASVARPPSHNTYTSPTFHTLNKADSRPKFITTFHPFILLPWPIWSMIALIITAAECPVALCALPTHSPAQITTGHPQPIKNSVYLSASLGPSISFQDKWPTGRQRSDLPVALSDVRHWSQMVCSVILCPNSAEVNVSDCLIIRWSEKTRSMQQGGGKVFYLCYPFSERYLYAALRNTGFGNL